MQADLTISNDLLRELLQIINSLAKNGLISDIREMLGRLINKFRNEGMYRVLSYESSLELMDTKGIRSRFHKVERLQYLQDNIIAFQDQAWGDGKILIDYQCKPGVPVDRYRVGSKTYILISLREVKSKDDIDTFVIDWKLQKGFLKSAGYWATEINHETDNVKTQIMFPKARPPGRITILEKNRQRTTSLEKNNIQQLPNGKWLVTWEKSRPVTNEQYIMQWVW